MGRREGMKRGAKGMGRREGMKRGAKGMRLSPIGLERNIRILRHMVFSLL